jgi:peroxiredoxin
MRPHRYNADMPSLRSVLTISAVLMGVACGAPPAGQSAAAPAFDLPNLAGGKTSLASFKGKVVVVDFWATWCGPCKFEIPGFIEMYSTYRARGFQVVGIAVDDPVPALQRYAAQMKMNYPILVGQGRDDVLAAFPPMPGLPTTFIIDRAGRICSSHTGLTERETFEKEIEALL